MSNFNRLLVFSLLGLLILILVIFSSLYARYLTTQVQSPVEEQTIQRTLTLTIPSDTEPGQHNFQLALEDSQEQTLLALSEQINLQIEDDNNDGDGGGRENNGDDGDGGGRENNGDDGDGGGGSGNGGGDGDGGGGSGEPEPEPAQPTRTYNYQAESAHQISGSFSGVRQDGNQTVVVLAHKQAILAKQISTISSDYWLDIRAKHDRPGPVDVAIYVNNKAWKIVRLNKNDNQYRIHRIGLLRNFSGGNIRFRLLNDTYDKNNPANSETDRNLHIDWWRLTTGGPSRAFVPSGVGGPSPSSVSSARPTTGRSAGRELLPQLNSYIRQYLGPRHVTPDIWSYYAHRLTVNPTARESIQSAEKLSMVMRFWKIVRPSRPRGD